MQHVFRCWIAQNLNLNTRFACILTYWVFPRWMDDYPVAVLAEFLRDLYVLYGSAAVKKHDENIVGNQPWRCKIEVYNNVELVYQPTFEDLDTAEQRHPDLCLKTSRTVRSWFRTKRSSEPRTCRCIWGRIRSSLVRIVRPKSSSDGVRPVLKWGTVR